MINVGFIIYSSKELMGVSNYLKNLIFAIASIKKRNIKVTVFVGKKENEQTKIFYKKYATVVEDSMFDIKSMKYFLKNLEYKIFSSNLFLEIFLKKHNINILSHSSIINLKNIKLINWIADFQHLHLPHMFSKNEVDKRNKYFRELIEKSNIIILSSFDALRDFNNFDNNKNHKAKVLQFVSQPNKIYFKLDLNDKKELLKQFNLEENFYYIPNHYWKHKNHMFVFKAINELKKEGIIINVVCTGYPDDYRNKDYFQNLITYVNKNNLNKNIRIFGVVTYEEVFSLIKFSKAVINPSLFEGWSSTVEECKSVGKNMILSDLSVHREQYPNETFFDKSSSTSFKNVIKNYEKKSFGGSKNLLEDKTNKFASTYVKILEELINN